MADVALDDRAMKVHVAKVLLNECRARRHNWVNRHFYWHLFLAAQRCRREAAAMSRGPIQRGLFA